VIVAVLVPASYTDVANRPFTERVSVIDVCDNRSSGSANTTDRVDTAVSTRPPGDFDTTDEVLGASAPHRGSDPSVATTVVPSGSVVVDTLPSVDPVVVLLAPEASVRDRVAIPAAVVAV
jgi:hypothetical protein